MSPSHIPNPEDDKFDEYWVSEMQELWKEWGEDVEGSGQLHRAILSNLMTWCGCSITWMTIVQKTYLGKVVEWWVQKGWRGVHHLVDDTRISQFVDCGTICWLRRAPWLK
jgi:hypothetical protein